jgi:hypothetical protein
MQYFFDSHSTPSLRAGFAYEGGDHHAAKGGVAGLITTVGKVIADYSHLSATTPAPTPTRKQHYLPKFSADTNASLQQSTDIPQNPAVSEGGRSQPHLAGANWHHRGRNGRSGCAEAKGTFHFAHNFVVDIFLIMSCSAILYNL